MNIRHVTSADRQAWLRMRRALWPDSADRHESDIARFFEMKSREPLAVFIAEDDGTPLGFAELSIRAYAEGCDTDRVAFLEGWYVIPEARNRGVGRALIGVAEDWGRSRGCTEFGSDAELDNDISASAHRALGFEEVAQIRCFRKNL